MIPIEIREPTIDDFDACLDDLVSMLLNTARGDAQASCWLLSNDRELRSALGRRAAGPGVRWSSAQLRREDGGVVGIEPGRGLPTLEYRELVVVCSGSFPTTEGQQRLKVFAIMHPETHATLVFDPRPGKEPKDPSGLRDLVEQTRTR